MTNSVPLQGQESMDRAWRGAEAHHFWLLAHRQLYRGAFVPCLRTALNLRRYADMLPPRGVFSLLAVAAFAAGYYGQCSRAFMKLEAMAGLSAAGRAAAADLATAIFVRHPPLVRVAVQPQRRSLALMNSPWC
jgi:WD repeat-containing protein 35